MSPITDRARKKMIQTALDAHEPGEELLNLPWRESSANFPVVRIHMDVVLLNHRSHRIRAQVESHPERGLLENEPHDEPAQELIAQILRDDEGFDELKTNLEDVGQLKAGVMTSEGLLVNANRRVVALRDLGIEYVRVAVLPLDAIEQEIDLLELHLQVTRDYKVDYSFANELLFVDDLITNYGRSHEDVAVELGWAASRETKELEAGKKRVQQAVRHFSLIREIQYISGGVRPLTAFDDERVAIEEIDQQYERLKTDSPAEARKTRDMRILGMIIGVQYRDLRQIDEAFLDEYFVEAFESVEELDIYVQILAVDDESGKGTEDQALPGLDVIDDEIAESGDYDPARLLELMAASANDETVELPTEEGSETVNREEFRANLQGALEDATQDKKDETKQQDKLKAPIDHLSRANRLLKRSLEAYEKVSSQEGFKLGKFKYQLRRVGRLVAALDEAVKEESAPE